MARPEVLFPLFASVDNIKGVGAKSQAALEKLGLSRIKDLLLHLPNSGIERTVPTDVLTRYLGRHVILTGVVGQHSPGRSRSAPYRIRFLLDDGEVGLVFFRAYGSYLEQQLPMGETRVISGKLERYGEALQITHPDFIGISTDEIPKFEPQYGLSEGLSQKILSRIITAAIDPLVSLPDWMRGDLTTKYDFPNWHDAVQSAHRPQVPQDIAPHAPARLRLAYDELLSHQLALALVRAKRKTPRGVAVQIDEGLVDRALASLPYELTNAQKRVFSEVMGDLRAPKRMFRMIQGDVGAGKTAVAFLAMAAALGGDGQVALLAPTEILARQHFQTLAPMFEALGFEAVIITGSDKGAKRSEKNAAVAEGRTRVIIGTHAIFQDSVEFANLTMAVVDEQHRFGVRERVRIAAKGQAVDLLAMSATPIPRSLAMAVYGEMDLSVLDEKPPGRTLIETSLLAEGKLDVLMQRVEAAIKAGRQVYWVTPLVEESEFLDVTAAEERYTILRHRLGEDVVGMAHGRLPSEKKATVMAKFVEGETKLLVATTVIEVGVDVPNASIMIIEGAERFGLSQLHQLRGRVGRGAEKSNCILVYGDRVGETSRERLELMRETDDGFRIAEADLRMRGAGDLIGTAQSGLPRFQIADLEVHADLMAVARDDARIIVDQDPDLTTERGEALRVLLYLTERDQSVTLISKA